MPRYKATIEYLGTNYAGWQKQNGVSTIQEQVETAIFKFCNKKVSVIGSGRTDAGVHSYGQVAHFDLPKVYQEHTIINALNFYLINTGISIVKVEAVKPNFHSIVEAKSRHYIYKIINRRAPLALEKQFALSVTYPLNINAMREASKYLIGIHDFSSFRSSECVANSAVKNVTKLDIINEGEKIDIHICANSFLHHMVRNIVGTLLLVGTGKICAHELEKIMSAKNRNAAGPTAPACGLYLYKVEY